VTVVTPSLPERARMLSEAVESVGRQTRPPVAHLVGVDTQRRGPAMIRNQLLAAVETEWVAFLDDDDLLKPDHLELLAGHDADVVIPYCEFDGPPLPPRYCNQPFNRDKLEQHGIFPITVVARTAVIREAGCFGPERYEDWALWNRLADSGARFEVIPTVTWTYRTAHEMRRTMVG
jgi:glycosyltransferase involved in cell wall biosynthesis